jgi:hypothetical protein
VELVALLAHHDSIPTNRILRHRELKPTQCPGDMLYARLPELRRAVGSIIDAPVVQPATWPLLEPGDTGAKVLAAQHLLRARGMKEVSADGVFSADMYATVQRFAMDNQIAYEPCYASRLGDESGLLGSSTWPLLVRTVRADEPDEVGRAARVLLDARGERIAGDRLIDTPTWQALLT